jgi:hypothetical protein
VLRGFVNDEVMEWGLYTGVLAGSVIDVDLMSAGWSHVSLNESAFTLRSVNRVTHRFDIYYHWMVKSTLDYLIICTGIFY